MDTVFSKFVHISLMANWLIVAVIVLRLLLKKVPRRVICVLWALVALRLMLPVSVESPVSMIPETTAILQEAVDTTLIHPEAVPSDRIPAGTQEGSTAAKAGGQIDPGLQQSKNKWRCDGIAYPNVPRFRHGFRHKMPHPEIAKQQIAQHQCYTHAPH